MSVYMTQELYEMSDRELEEMSLSPSDLCACVNISTWLEEHHGEFFRVCENCGAGWPAKKRNGEPIT